MRRKLIVASMLALVCSVSVGCSKSSNQSTGGQTITMKSMHNLEI